MSSARTSDTRALRRMLGQFATGVAVVTAACDAGHACLTVSSFTSVSLDPPLVLFSVRNESALLPAFLRAPVIGVSILDESQRELSTLFAGRTRDQWNGKEGVTGSAGALLIRGAIARMECERWAVHDGGDHRVFVCRLLSYEHQDGANPLLYFQGRYCSLGSVSASA
jgi:flavin reductase (DIM6/NTAB) family NADH-FMN oxidoreductase RutF